MKLKTKYVLSYTYAILWLLFSLYFAIPWIDTINYYLPPDGFIQLELFTH